MPAAAMDTKRVIGLHISLCAEFNVQAIESIEPAGTCDWVEIADSFDGTATRK
jgi:hypothetical protein